MRFTSPCTAIILVAILSATSHTASAQAISLSSEPAFEDQFDYPGSALPDTYWLEGSGSASVVDGKLILDALGDMQPGTATLWLRPIFSGDIRVEFEASVIDARDNANNINFFLLFSDPRSDNLYHSRMERMDGAYPRYGCPDKHAARLCGDRRLQGYILTNVAADTPPAARFRLREAPGFHLLAESTGHSSRQGETYSIVIIKRGGLIQYLVDGAVHLAHHDKGEKPVHRSGQLAFRTWNTKLAIDNFRVFSGR